MKVREYFKALGIDLSCYIEVCFVIGKVVGEGHSKSFMYRNSPIRTAHEWIRFDESDRNDKILDYNVINIKQPTISWMSGADWNHRIANDKLMSLLVVSDTELHKYYSINQSNEMMEFITKKINKGIDDGSNPWIMGTK